MKSLQRNSKQIVFLYQPLIRLRVVYRNMNSKHRKKIIFFPSQSKIILPKTKVISKKHLLSNCYHSLEFCLNNILFTAVLNSNNKGPSKVFQSIPKHWQTHKQGLSFGPWPLPLMAWKSRIILEELVPGTIQSCVLWMIAWLKRN